MTKKHSTLKTFVTGSRKGDRFVYHAGDLAQDRKNSEQINAVALEALDFYQRGFIELVQKRNGKHNYDYLAVRTVDVGRRFFKGCYEATNEEE